VRRWKLVVYRRELKWLNLDHKKKQSFFPLSEQCGRNTHTFAKSSRRMASRGSRGTAPLILSLSTRWRDGDDWSTSRTGRCTSGENPGSHWIVGWLGGLQNHSGRFTGENNFLHLTRLETRIVRLVSHSLPATLSRCQSQTKCLIPEWPLHRLMS
jgi:hypothetical protein